MAPFLLLLLSIIFHPGLELAASATVPDLGTYIYNLISVLHMYVCALDFYDLRYICSLYVCVRVEIFQSLQYIYL